MIVVSFHVLFGCLCVFFGGCPFRSSAHFLIGLLVFCLLFLTELHVYFGDNPLSFTAFANIFPCILGCLFILFMASFAMQNLLSLIRSHLFIFVLIFITPGGGLKIYYYDERQRVFCLCFPLRIL